MAYRPAVGAVHVLLSVPLLSVLPTIVLTVPSDVFVIVSVYSTLPSAAPFFSAVFSAVFVVRVSAVPEPGVEVVTLFSTVVFFVTSVKEGSS